MTLTALFPLPHRALVTLPLLALAATACRGGAAGGASTGETGGMVVITSPAEPATLFPATAKVAGEKAVVELIYDRLAEPGPSMQTVGDKGFEPRLSDHWAWAADSLSIAFHLNPKARWHDGAPVRAGDVRFTYAVYSDPALASPSLQLLQNVDSVTVRDSLTAVIWFKHHRPEQFYDATYNVLILPEHLLAHLPRRDLETSEIVRKPVGTGRFRFATWTPGQRLELVADTQCYRGRAKLDRVVWAFAPDPVAATTKLFTGEADFDELLAPPDVAELAKHPSLRTHFYAGMGYYFLGFNLKDTASKGARAHPVFGDRATRRALAMALDRQAMLRNVLDTLAYLAIGPLTRAVWTADSALHPLPYDPGRAARALDSLGWREVQPGRGRIRNGRRLRFSIIVPTTSRSRVRYATLIQEQLRRIGAQVDVEPVDINALVTRMQARRYDALIGAWSVDPSPSAIRQTWSGKAALANDGSNSGGYDNPAFDALVDSAMSEFDAAKARREYQRAYQMLIDDAPAVFLYELRPVAGAHKRIRVTGMRGDAWWAGLPDWTVPAAERLERDRLGLRVAAP